MYKSHQLSNFNAILVKVIFEPFVANYLSLLFLWVVLVAHLMWASERRVNDDEFPRTYLDGIDDAVWWAIVTVTTVGYGDKSPKSPTGRVIAMIWMILGLFIFSVLSGHMSSRFVELQSVSTINGVRDLSGLRVCSYYGNFELAHYFPDSIEMQAVEADDVRACGELLRSGDVDAVVMEMGLMAYYARNDPWAVRLAGSRSYRPLGRPTATPPCFRVPIRRPCIATCLSLRRRPRSSPSRPRSHRSPLASSSQRATSHRRRWRSIAS